MLMAVVCGLRHTVVCLLTLDHHVQWRHCGSIGSGCWTSSVTLVGSVQRPATAMLVNHSTKPPLICSLTISILYIYQITNLQYFGSTKLLLGIIRTGWAINGATLFYWHFPHGMQSVVYVTVKCLSVHLSQHGPTAAKLHLQVCCCGPRWQEIHVLISCCSSIVRQANVQSSVLSVYWLFMFLKYLDQFA